MKIKVYKWACRLGVFPLLVASLLGLLSVKQVTAQDAGGTPQPEIPVPQAPTPSQVIEAINTLRMSLGIAPL